MRTSSAAAIVFLCAAPLASPLAAQQFHQDPTALPAQNIWTDGVALADVDGDGDVDILFANGNAYGGTGVAGALPQHLFLNDGTGHFVAAHSQLNVVNFNAKMVIAEDLDRDGDVDLMYASGSDGSPPRLLLNQGGAQGGTQGVFADVTATNVPPLFLKSFGICAGDVDDDGDADIVVTDGGTFSGVASQARLLLNDGTAHFTDVTAAQMPADLYKAQDVTLFDVDGDADIDIALSGKTTGARLYLNDGSGHFSASTALSSVGTSGTYEFDYGDLNGDTTPDAVVMSIAGFTEGWAQNVGTAAPWPKTVFTNSPGQDDNEMACLDYDNDGDLDVIVGSLGPSETFYNNAGGVLTSVAGVIEAVQDSTLDLGIADLQGDGRCDIVTAQGESGNFTNRVYINSGPQDTRPPKFTAVPAPPLGQGRTMFHTRVSDAISDDGTTNVRVTYFWSVGGGSLGSHGSGTATHMGGDLFRAPVVTPAGTHHATVRFTATDSAGNSAFSTVDVVWN